MTSQVKGPATAEEARDIIRGLEERLRQNAERVRGLPTRRNAAAFAASQGDPDALAELRKVDEEETALEKDERNLNAALAEANRLYEPLAKVERNERLKHKHQRAQNIIDRRAQVSVQIDTLFGQLRTAFQERDVIGNELASLDIFEDPIWLSVRLSDRTQIKHAMQSAGLTPFLGLGMDVSQESAKTLAQQDKDTFRLPTLRLEA